MNECPDFDSEIRRSIIALKNTLNGPMPMSDAVRTLRDDMRSALERQQTVQRFTSADAPQRLIYQSTNGERQLVDHGWLLPTSNVGDDRYWLTVKAKILHQPTNGSALKQILLDEVREWSTEFHALNSALLQFMDDVLFSSIQQDLL